MKTYSLFIFLLVIYSCHRAEPKIKMAANTTRLKCLSRQQYLIQAQKDREIYGAFELSRDSIILLRRSVGIELSINSGKSSQWLAKDIANINEFTVDDKGVWWGLEYWIGIHESSYCRLHKSVDRGKTWSDYIFNTSVFFPTHIYSKVHMALAITNFSDNKIYQLSGNDPQHNWRNIKQLPKKDELADISVENYFVSRANNKLYVKRINGKIDTLMGFPKAWDIYNIEKNKNKIYIAGPKGDNSDDSYFAIILNERLLKEYIIPGGDVNIILGKSGRVFITSTTGAYLLQGTHLSHIF
jgi:hypothetical protein